MRYDPEEAEQLLVEQLRRNDEHAWAEFFAAHRDGVFGVCWRMLGNREKAADASQEVFLRAVKGIRRFRGESKLATWLHQIACNLCLDWLAAAGRTPVRVTDESDVERVADEQLDGDRVLTIIELRKAVKRALAKLEPASCESIVLRELEELSYQEIATVTGVPINTVKTRIRRARIRLRHLLAEFSSRTRKSRP